jgi:sortase A
MRRAARILGTLLAAGGLVGLAWALTVWQWQDPFTALYTSRQQHRLAEAYDREVSRYRPRPRPPKRLRKTPAQLIGQEARVYRKRLRRGEAVGRIKVPRLGLNAILVNGTDHDSLTKGPGRYRGSYIPGEGQLVYIAGHRTTYGAPFAHIEQLRRGDRVTIELPYAAFVYRVRGHVIVPANDVERLRTRGHEVVALQACHPRFFATERYIVYAVPIRVKPSNGRPYSPKV